MLVGFGVSAYTRSKAFYEQARAPLWIALLMEPVAGPGGASILVACGLYGNVFRLLPPLTATGEELERGFELFDEALAQA